MSKLYKEYLKNLKEVDFSALEDNGDILRSVDVSDTDFQAWRNIGITPIDYFYNADGSLQSAQEHIPLIFLQQDGKTECYELSTDGEFLIINGEKKAFKTYYENNIKIYELSDGTILRDVSMNYA
ncbi:MAG: hypothetical protein LBM93_14630 [Oscillospiraceae bacterium]|jgi:hypothetical protein|nr:hypothetical protein [Oscillospiraceae bacterium]